jgi:hypothetical protein
MEQRPPFSRNPFFAALPGDADQCCSLLLGFSTAKSLMVARGKLFFCSFKPDL